MKLLPIIVAGITVVVAAVNYLSGPDLQTKSLPTSRITYPEGKPSGVVVLLSDGTGWSDNEEKTSETLVEEGAVVVGVDLPNYYAALNLEAEGRKAEGCLYLVSDIEDLTRQLHRELGLDDYQPPVIAGIGDGATLALAIAAQTPDSTISETLAVDPETSIPLSTVLCTPATKRKVIDGTVYGLTEGELPNPVRVVFTSEADVDGLAHAEDLKESHPEMELSSVKGDADTALLNNLQGILQDLSRAASPLGLPIIPTEVPARQGTMAVIYSGDGGWRDIDQKLAAYLAEDGIPSVGVDALRYFWSEKTPDETAADLSRIIDTYKARWKVDHVVLIGYSFGANILPATYRNLPEADRQSVSLVSMLALSHQADFQIAVTGWLGIAGEGRHGDPVEDLRAAEPYKIQCIYGRDEEDSACPAVKAITGADVVTRDGGHHFDGDYRALSKLIVQRAEALIALD